MNIVIIGSGSVATHLATALSNKGITISQIYSRTEQNAKLLADELHTSCTNNILEINKFADLYIYALNDKSIEYFISKFELPPHAIHVHTAGSVSLTVFEGITEKYGVFYPLQTFSKHRSVDFSNVPICIEAVNTSVENKLHELAMVISSNVYYVKSDQRKKLHLAAVFACNFTNYMYDISNELVKKAGFSLDIIKPLILETSDKLNQLSPYEAQTGPAKRADDETIAKHLLLLSNNSNWKKIYKLLSISIEDRHKKKNSVFEKIKMFQKRMKSNLFNTSKNA